MKRTDIFIDNKKSYKFHLQEGSKFRFKNFRIFLFFLFFFLIFFKPDTSRSQWAILTSSADSLIKVGSDYIYNAQFDNATKCFTDIKQQFPNHPAGYFLDAMIEWWKITIYRESEQYDDIFLNKINKVIDVCNKILDSNEFDIGALFFKGGALGYRGRYYVVRNSWFKAATDGYNAFQILLKCQLTAPYNHDIMLGTGIYNYFAEAIPEEYPAAKTLILFGPKGDKKLGIYQLQAASRLARYASVEAKVVLMQVFQDFEKNSAEALPITMELHNKYPNNPYFYRYMGRCLVSQGQLELWEKAWRDILMRYIDNQPGYDVMTAREALYYVALALMTKGKNDLALKYFYKCDEASRKIDKKPSGFMIVTNMKIGKLYDIIGKRSLAISQYHKILAWEDYQGSHQEANELIKKPFGK